MTGVWNWKNIIPIEVVGLELRCLVLTTGFYRFWGTVAMLVTAFVGYLFGVQTG